MNTYDLGSIVADISEVPESWIYKFFYEELTKGSIIQQPFDGRIIKVKSIRNRDTNPSLCFFHKNGKYFWRDFSEGQGGNAVSFVSSHFNKTPMVAVEMILRKYEEFLIQEDHNLGAYSDKYVTTEIKKPQFSLTESMMNQQNLDFWQYFKMNINVLNKFKIRYIPEYKIKKGDDIHTFNGQNYGFFNSSGCYQLYQPFNAKCKYLLIDPNYLIGSEQLEFKYNVCIIGSGLKDIGAASVLNLRCEYVAPPSENTLLSKDKIDWLKSKYNFILTMFDNDEAGIKGMRLYEKIYNIPYVHIKLKKDLAENNTHFPENMLRHHYTMLINEKLEKYGTKTNAGSVGSV